MVKNTEPIKVAKNETKAENKASLAEVLATDDLIGSFITNSGKGDIESAGSFFNKDLPKPEEEDSE